MTLIELIATLSGILCVFLLIRQSIWGWPVGLIQVFLYIWIFWEAKLYSDVALHIIYIGLQCYGWWSWLYGNNNQPLVVRVGSWSQMLWVCMICMAASVMLGHVMHRFTDASLPYPDAFTTVASLIAQWLLIRKYLQTWVFWIVVDVVAIGIYLSKELYLTAGLYAFFLVMAASGFLVWLRHYRGAFVTSGRAIA